MQILTSLDLLYFTLSIISAIIWTLLAIVLIRLIKILWVVVELTWYYNKIKKIITYYKHIPEMVKEKVMSIINKKDS